MKWRRLAAVFIMLVSSVPALSAAAQQPSQADLRAVLQDDDRFAQLMTEMWVLRDLLALQTGGNISAEATEFQTLQDRLREQRTTILEKFGEQQPNVNFPREVVAAADRFSASLEQFGVQRDSQLDQRLSAASMFFATALSAGSLGSLCDLHPFRTLCTQP
jgi:hypothetical protein